MPCLKPSLEQDGNLGPTPLGLETALLSAARCAGLWRDRKDAGISWDQKVPALHREAERDTTGSFSRQPLVHTSIGSDVQGKRRCGATLGLICRASLKLRLTLQFYCDKRAARRHRFVGG